MTHDTVTKDQQENISFRLYAIFRTRFIFSESEAHKEYKQLVLPKVSLIENDIPYLQGIMDTIKTELRLKKNRKYFRRLDDEKSVRQLNNFINLIEKHKILNIYLDI